MIRVESSEDHDLSLDAIQIDGGTQSRANLNQTVVDDYAALMKEGVPFPPITVFYDGKKHWLADGFHRVHAYRKAGKEKVAVDVRQGTRRDAILHSVGANASHGLRRTNDDKRRAVRTLLDDSEWSTWSDSDIRKKCAVSLALVQKLRSEITYCAVSEKPAPPPPVPAAVRERAEKIEAVGGNPRFYKNKHGQVAVMNISGINASRKTGGDQTKEITFETLAPQGIEGGDESVSAAVEITPDAIRAGHVTQYHVMQLRSAWTKANAEALAIFMAETNLQFQAKASEDNGATGSDSEVPTDSMAGEVSRVDAGRTASATSENGRDGSERRASNFPSATPAEAAPASPKPPALAGAADNSPDPRTPQVDDGRPDPGSDAAGAKSDVPHIVGQSGIEPVGYFSKSEHQPAAKPQDRNEPVSGEPASVTQFINPRCQKPETCKWAHSQASCSACFNAAMKARAA